MQKPRPSMSGPRLAGPNFTQEETPPFFSTMKICVLPFFLSDSTSKVFDSTLKLLLRTPDWRIPAAFWLQPCSQLSSPSLSHTRSLGLSRSSITQDLLASKFVFHLKNLFSILKNRNLFLRAINKQGLNFTQPFSY